MARCKYFIPVEQGCRQNCANCQRWTGKRCRDEQLLRERYEESDEFKMYDYLMRHNKAIRWPL